MRKALHDSILVIKDGKEPQRYDRDSIESLIDGANFFPEEGENENESKSKIVLSKSLLNLMSEFKKTGHQIN